MAASLPVSGIDLTPIGLVPGKDDLQPIVVPDRSDLPPSAIPVRLRPGAWILTVLAEVNTIFMNVPDSVISPDETGTMSDRRHAHPDITMQIHRHAKVTSNTGKEVRFATMTYIFNDADAGSIHLDDEFLDSLHVQVGQPFERMHVVQSMMRDRRNLNVYVTFAVDDEDVEVLKCRLTDRYDV